MRRICPIFRFDPYKLTNNFLRKSIIILLFLVNLHISCTKYIQTGKPDSWHKLETPTKIFCTEAGYWVSIQCPKNLESINENDWKSTRMGFNLQDTVTVYHEDGEYFYSNKKIQGGIVVYRFPKETFTPKPPPENLKKYVLGKEKTLYISKEPSKTSEIIDSLKMKESVFCYGNKHKETEEGYWVKITSGDWTDSASVRWICTKHLDSLDLNIQPVCLNAKEVMEYPNDLRWKGIHGKVLAELWIDEKGDVRKVIIKESTHPGLNKAAEKTAYKLKFRPALGHSKKPSRVRVLFPIIYTLTR